VLPAARGRFRGRAGAADADARRGGWIRGDDEVIRGGRIPGMTPDALLAARTAGWPDDARGALGGVVETLRPSARHLADVLDWLEDIAARDGTMPGAILGDAELRAIAASGGSAPERLKRWKARLRRLRYPRLAARERAVAEHIRALACGPHVVITPPTDLEGGIVTVTIRVRTASDLRAAIERLDAGIAGGDVARLFALLDET
jgi:hypothetical protein